MTMIFFSWSENSQSKLSDLGASAANSPMLMTQCQAEHLHQTVSQIPMDHMSLSVDQIWSCFHNFQREMASLGYPMDSHGILQTFFGQTHNDLVTTLAACRLPEPLARLWYLWCGDAFPEALEWEFNWFMFSFAQCVLLFQELRITWTYLNWKQDEAHQPECPHVG